MKFVNESFFIENSVIHWRIELIQFSDSSHNSD